MSFYDEWTVSKLFEEFFDRLNLDKKIFFTSICPEDEKIDALAKSFDFSLLNDAQIEVIKMSIDEFLKNGSYENYLKDWEDEEYCVHIAHSIIRKCDKELQDRNSEKQNERTSK